MSHATVEVVLPADVVQQVEERCANEDRTQTLEELMLAGAELLSAEARAPEDTRHRLAMAWGNALLHWTRLLDAEYALTALAHEVWDLDERVHGVRPSDPPVDLPRLEQRVPVAVPASTQVIITPEEAGPDGSAAADLRDLLCYGLGAVSASAVSDEDVPFRANELNSAFSAYKYDLFIALKSIQVLEFRRAALGAMLQSRRRRADLMRRALKTDQ